MSTLAEWGSRIARSALAIENISNGPWQGSMESRPSDLIPRDHARGTDSTNFLYLPRTGTFKRRGGQTQKFDTFGAAVGMLPALWVGDSKARQMDEFLSGAVNDGIPTVCALISKEDVVSGFDDGWFAQFWWRDQVAGANRTIGSEYSLTTTYPVVGSTQTYLVVPLWYESGDGGITRGTTEFLRRFFASGSRRFLKAGNWWYFPNLKGTPCRWNGAVATEAAAAIISPSSTLQTGLTAGSSWASSTYGAAQGTGTVPAGDDLSWYQEINDRDDADYLRMGGFAGDTISGIFGLNGTVSSTITSWTITYRARYVAGGPGGYAAIPADATFRFRLARSDAFGELTTARTIKTYYTASFVTYTEELVFTGAGNSQTANSLRMDGFTGASGGIEAGSGIDIAWVEVSATSGGTAAINRLIPSGPLSPTHAGTIATGTITTGEAIAQTSLPDADISDGTWLNQSGSATNLYASIDESIADDLDYIQTPDGSITSCDISMSDLTVTPAANSVVRVNFRARRVSGNTAGQLSVYLVDGSTIRASLVGISTTSLTGEVNNFSFTLTPDEISSITAGGGWTNLTLRFATEKRGGFMRSNYYAQITWASITYAPSVTLAEGAWRGRDRFLYSVAYRFEDGSVWSPCVPRLPQATGITAGYNMMTLNAASPDSQYDFITWSSIPIGPHGVVGRLLLRTPRVDSTITGDELKLNPFDLRVVWELTDNTTTTYVDYQADDFGLAEDSAGLFVRYDHIMPPRSRYIAGGDMRIVHAYGGQNPCAITIAPVGRSSDYDLNLLDTNATLYTSQASYMRYRIETDGNATLKLVQGDGATATNSKTFDMDDYLTLQKLVDAINATSFAVDGQMWRAQLCPGVNPEAPSKTALAPHIREIASAVTANTLTTLTKAAGGLSTVPVGALISMTNVTAGTYVKSIDSDTQLTMSAAAIGTGTNTASFHASLGDVAITGELGWQRVISNSLPGFLYFTTGYLDDDPIVKSSVWMTTASPGSMRSAANNFSGKLANRFQPPSNAGVSMGGGSVGQGFVLPFADKVYVLKNTRDASTGIDEDYKLIELNATRGCIAWNTVTPGPGFVPYLTAEGLCCADLDSEVLISEAIWNHAPATGSMSYEVPLCVSAAAADSDGAYASARVLRSAIWLNYRTSASASHPNRQVVLDFSSGHVSSGLAALFRQPGVPWGWSTPLVRSVTAMCEGRRSDGGHLYGWNDANAGSAGDGRIDEIETTDTDNGTAIAAELRFTWERLGRHYKLSAQELVVEHKAPAGSTVLMDFHRSYSDAVSTLTMATTSADVGREIKLLPQAARVVTAACFVGYRQTAGGAAELRAFVLRAKSVPSYT